MFRKTIKDIRLALAIATLAASAGISPIALAMPEVDVAGRGNNWTLEHSAAMAPRLTAERNVEVVFGRSSVEAMPAGRATMPAESVTVESRNIGTFGRG